MSYLFPHNFWSELITQLLKQQWKIWMQTMNNFISQTQHSPVHDHTYTGRHPVDRQNITELQSIEKQFVYSAFSKQNSNISVLIINCCTFNKKIQLKNSYLPSIKTKVEGFVLRAITVLCERQQCVALTGSGRWCSITALVFGAPPPKWHHQWPHNSNGVFSFLVIVSLAATEQDVPGVSPL